MLSIYAILYKISTGWCKTKMKVMDVINEVKLIKNIDKLNFLRFLILEVEGKMIFSGRKKQ